MTRRRGGAATAAILMCALAVTAVTGCKDELPDTGSGSGSGGQGPTAGGGAALTAARALTVKGRAPKTGYERERFGTAWADTDSNGCDTRVISILRGMIAGISQLMPGAVRYAY